MIRANVDYYVRFAALPIHIGGACVPNDDGTIDIYVNQNVCPSKRVTAFCHELSHIYLEHLIRDNISDKVKEQEADHFAPFMKQLVEQFDPEILEAVRNG